MNRKASSQLSKSLFQLREEMDEKARREASTLSPLEIHTLTSRIAFVVDTKDWASVAKLAATVDPLQLRRAFWFSYSESFLEVEDEEILKAVFGAGVTIEDIVGTISSECQQCHEYHSYEDECGSYLYMKRDVLEGQDLFDVRRVKLLKGRFRLAAANPTLVKLWISMGMVKNVSCFWACMEEKNPATLPLLLEEVHKALDPSYLSCFASEPELLKNYAPKFSLDEITNQLLIRLCITVKESMEVLISNGLEPKRVSNLSIEHALLEADVPTLEFLRDWGLKFKDGFSSGLSIDKLRFLKDSKMQLPVMTAKEIEPFGVQKFRVLLEWGLSRDVCLEDDNFLIRNAFKNKDSEMIDFLYSLFSELSHEEFCALSLGKQVAK